MSNTRWKELLDKSVPNTAADLQLDGICHCLLKSGHLFQWKVRRPPSMWQLSDWADLLVHSDPDLEKAMWLLQELFAKLRIIVEGTGGYILGQVIQQALVLVDQLNTLEWPLREKNLAEMIINCKKSWSAVAPGQYKVPWYLVCNQSLTLWLQAELVMKRMLWHKVKQSIAKTDYIYYAIVVSKLLLQSLKQSEFSDLEYITGLKRRCKTNQVKVFVVLGTATHDDREKFALFDRAVKLWKGDAIPVDIEQAQLEGLEAEHKTLSQVFVGTGTIGFLPDADSLFAKHEANININIPELMTFDFVGR